MRIILLTILLVLAGCVTTTTDKQLDIIGIKGLAGSVYSRGIGNGLDKIKTTHPHLSSGVFSHTRTGLWRYSPTTIIGHSLGANRAIKEAQELNNVGRTLPLLILFDPVSFRVGGNMPDTYTIPPNVKRVVVFLSNDFRAKRVVLQNPSTQLEYYDDGLSHIEIDDYETYWKTIRSIL